MNIWRLSDLHPWHVATAVCATCGQREVLQLAVIRAQHPEFVYLHDLYPWLACAACGDRQAALIEVAPRGRDI